MKYADVHIRINVVYPNVSIAFKVFRSSRGAGQPRFGRPALSVPASRQRAEPFGLRYTGFLT